MAVSSDLCIATKIPAIGMARLAMAIGTLKKIIKLVQHADDPQSWPIEVSLYFIDAAMATAESNGIAKASQKYGQFFSGVCFSCICGAF